MAQQNSYLQEHMHHDHASHESLDLEGHLTHIREEDIQKAGEIFDSLDFHHIALSRKIKLNKYYLAIKMYLDDPENFKNALADHESPYHKAAKRRLRDRKAKAYFAEDPNNLLLALKHRGNRYHKKAVMKFLSHRNNFINAYTNEHHRLHRAAVHLAHKYGLIKTDEPCQIQFEPVDATAAQSPVFESPAPESPVAYLPAAELAASFPSATPSIEVSVPAGAL